MYPKPIYVVDGARTPFLKSKNRPGPFAASDLATQAGRTLLARQKFAPDELDEVILGCAAPSVDEVNIGRVAALRMGCGQQVPGWTVMRNCASGMQAVDSGISNILAGRSELVLAGGGAAAARDRGGGWTRGGGSARVAAVSAGPLMAADGKGVPLLARDAEAVRDVLRGLAHQQPDHRVGESFHDADHRSKQRL